MMYLTPGSNYNLIHPFVITSHLIYHSVVNLDQPTAQFLHWVILKIMIQLSHGLPLHQRASLIVVTFLSDRAKVHVEIVRHVQSVFA